MTISTSISGTLGKVQSTKYHLDKKQIRLYYALISDFKPSHRKILRSLKEVKKRLIYHMNDSHVLAADVHKMFWLYYDIGHDIVLNRYLKKHLSKFSIITPTETLFSAEQYRSLLAYIRGALSNFQSIVSKCMDSAHSQIPEKIKNGLKESYTDYEGELYQDHLKLGFIANYSEYYTEEDYAVFTGFDDQSGIINIDKLIEYVAIISRFPNYHDLFDDLKQQLPSDRLLTLNDVSLPVGDLLSILESLNFPQHLFV